MKKNVKKSLCLLMVAVMLMLCASSVFAVETELDAGVYIGTYYVEGSGFDLEEMFMFVTNWYWTDGPYYYDYLPVRTEVLWESQVSSQHSAEIAVYGHPY